MTEFLLVVNTIEVLGVLLDEIPLVLRYFGKLEPHPPDRFSFVQLWHDGATVYNRTNEYKLFYILRIKKLTATMF